MHGIQLYPITCTHNLPAEGQLLTLISQHAVGSVTVSERSNSVRVSILGLQVITTE